MTLLPQRNVLLIQPQQTRIARVTILPVTVTTVIVVVTIHMLLLQLKLLPQQFWFAEAIITTRSAEATKIFFSVFENDITDIQ